MGWSRRSGLEMKIVDCKVEWVGWAESKVGDKGGMANVCEECRRSGV